MHFRQILAALALVLATVSIAAWRHEEPHRVVVTDTTTEMLDEVRFAPGTALIAPESTKTLDAVAETLQGNPSIAQVEVQSHTVGTDDAAALDLSDARAAAVTRYLVSKGVDASRLSPQGYGNTQPIGSPEKNERIAFLILKRVSE